MGRGAASLMVQGTCSGAGKSIVVAGLCRIFSDRGIKVAPFKSQNMALNSYVTEDGGEIGRAQALQAEAARAKASTDMNPILLKATGDASCQVIVNGKVHSAMTARQYYSFKDHAWRAAAGAYERLSSDYDLVVIEGAGSPAEINLMEDEIVNMKVARHAGCPVVLVGDIDRGGVFASLYGTIALLDGDAGRIKGFVINKFRGDVEILRPGLEQISRKTGVPVVGVVPYVRDLWIDEEDELRHTPRGAGGAGVKVVVVALAYMSNFTDFDPFRFEPGVELLFSASGPDIESADLVIVPGSKNTVTDLLALKRAGLDGSIRRAASRGTNVVGICGGYQMLGRRITDPGGVESPLPVAEGLGLLDVETEIRAGKTTAQASAKTALFGFGGTLRGYEIHMGVTTGGTGAFRIERLPHGEIVQDGTCEGNVFGTYLHGIFDDDEFRACLLDDIRRKKGLPASGVGVRYREVREHNIQRWADLLAEHLDMGYLHELAGI